jgi:hypothetical protein
MGIELEVLAGSPLNVVLTRIAQNGHLQACWRFIPIDFKN